MDYNQNPKSRRFRVVGLVVTVVGACLAVYWLVKWLRGDSNEYPNQIVGGLTLATALTCFALKDFVRTPKLQWTIFGIGATMLVIAFSVVFTGTRFSLLAVIGLLIVLGSIIRTTYVLWPKSGVSFGEWKTMPASPEQVRAVCTGMATRSLGATISTLPLVELRRGAWLATAISGVTTLVFFGTTVLFLVLRSRIRAR
jgi:hypothetical protein